MVFLPQSLYISPSGRKLETLFPWYHSAYGRLVFLSIIRTILQLQYGFVGHHSQTAEERREINAEGENMN